MKLRWLLTRPFPALLILLFIFLIWRAQISRKPPDVFIYLIDALRADHLTCYGYDRPTSPVMDKFAREAALFEQAQTTVTWTRPATTSVLTGLYGSAHRVMSHSTKLDDKLVLISEILSEAGYRTSAISTNKQVGEAFGFQERFDFFECKNLQTPDWVNARATGFLAKSGAQPVFMYLHTIEPHSPYAPKAETLALFERGFEGSCDGSTESLANVNWVNPDLSEDDMQHLIDLYDAEIFDNDTGFGEFLDLLKQTGRYDNALIILTADHGESFADHGTMQHAHCLNKEEMHVPLIVRFPKGRFRGMRFRQPVSRIDIFPTILSQTQSNPHLDYDLPGIDLIRLASGSSGVVPRRLYAELSRLETSKLDQLALINKQGYKRILDISIRGQRKAPEQTTGLWNLRVDPKEQVDLSSSQVSYCAAQDAQLLRWREKQQTWRPISEDSSTHISEETLRELRALGYLR